MNFGTDGIRGRFGSIVTEELARKFGWAFAANRLAQGRSATFAIARDTRASGSALEAAIREGITAGGGDTILVGVIPTPALSQFILERRISGGIMITASHNPPEDNGLKPLNNLGRKLDDLERIEIQNLMKKDMVQSNNGIFWSNSPDGSKYWLEKIKDFIVDSGSFGLLSGRSIVLDSANGAGINLLESALSGFGANIISIGNDTKNGINTGCGSLHPELMVKTVKDSGAIAGIALDGDGDRIQVCDKWGTLFDGDDILWMLKGDAKIVVGTLMTNEGLSSGLTLSGATLIRTAVGDANVWNGMVKNSAEIGGEPSGHILFRDGMPTSCGTFTAAKLLALDPKNWRECNAGWTRFHQAIRKAPLQGTAHLSGEINRLKSLGLRVIVRASGTEPIIRLMVEGEEKDFAEYSAQKLLNMLHE
jgi:phosphoglucosamine mutase